MRSDPFLKRLFREYNARYFAAVLPRLTTVRWHTDEDLAEGAFDEGCMGICWIDTERSERDEIILDTSLRHQGLWRVIRGVLLHEMTHLKRRETGHGAGFEADMEALVNAGAYKDLL